MTYESFSLSPIFTIPLQAETSVLDVQNIPKDTSISEILRHFQFLSIEFALSILQGFRGFLIQENHLPEPRIPYPEGTHRDEYKLKARSQD